MMQGDLNLDFNDEIVAGTVVAHQGISLIRICANYLGLAEFKEEPEQETVATAKAIKRKNINGNFNFIAGAFCAVAISRC